MAKFTICVLLYGNHPELAHRCLNSIWERLGSGVQHIQDIRLGLNEIFPATREIVDWFIKNLWEHYRIPTVLYNMPKNACKYPVMRKMLLLDAVPPGELVMWFDDDSYLNFTDAGWWEQVLGVMEKADIAGQLWRIGLQGKQAQWLKKQSWYNPKVGLPRSLTKFCTGGWWVIRTSVLQRYNWPPPALKHRGGDSMLGELCRQQGLKISKFDKGVRINADDRGRHSKSARRGYDEPEIGKKTGALADESCDHQEFVFYRTYFAEVPT